MKQFITKNDLASIFFILKIYALVLSIFTSYRLLLFGVEYARLGDGTSAEILQAFVMGFRFDVVISSYILIVPFFVITLLSFFKQEGVMIQKIIFYFCLMLFSIAFMVSAADIPYFGQFFNRFSVAAFEWMDTPDFVLEMIWQEPSYLFFAILAIVIIVIFAVVLSKIFKNQNNFLKAQNPKTKAFISLIFLVLIFIGIRGRVEEKSPIRIGTAFFCNNAFLNKLGLNPNFTLIRSYLESIDKRNQSISLMDEQEAIKNVQQYLGITNILAHNPLARQVNFDSIGSKQNVVVIIMESMSTAKMKRHGNPDNLTPFLDSISKEGLYFDNCYTAGIHTYNGVFGTIFSYPAIFAQHSMKERYFKEYNNLASTLKQQDYSTIYFTTCDGQFDNVAGFLTHNKFDQIVEKKDYPSHQIKTTLGVPDDYLFEHSIPILKQLHQKGKPFLSVFMTCSDHAPYYIPDYFKPKQTDIKKQIVEYADYSLNKFIDLAKQQDWFENTLFVFVADHGAPMSSYYDISLDYVHAPLLFYAPKLIQNNQTISKIAGQIDIFPSIMGFLKLPYENSTMGIDLFSENRPYILFNGDDKYGVLDQEWLLIVRMDKSITLHQYRTNNRANYAKEHPEIVQKMQLYGASHLQTFQHLVNHVLK